MPRLIYILLLLMFAVSCRKSAQNTETAVLTDRTCVLIDLFLDNTKQWRKGHEQIIIGGRKDEKLKYYIFWIYANDPDIQPTGTCHGVVQYKTHEVMLFGDSWDDYFWLSDTTYELTEKGWACEYDPPVWELYISLKDTSISDVHSELTGYYNPYQILDISDEMARNRKGVLDSIQNIIRQ